MTRIGLVSESRRNPKTCRGFRLAQDTIADCTLKARGIAAAISPACSGEISRAVPVIAAEPSTPRTTQATRPSRRSIFVLNACRLVRNHVLRPETPYSTGVTSGPRRVSIAT